MGRLSGVRVVPLEDVPPIDLPGGSWSRVLLTGERVGSTTALGFSSFAAATSTAMLSHATEELAYVLSGKGELRLDDEVVPYEAGSALFIPAGVWHAVANTGSDPVTMVFAFPHPDYPPTERRSAGASSSAAGSDSEP
ncbi:MAG: cupin domain-containing protein [Chloroflexi bacterium]|nr:cupin domain-containing protein [Chloroflexota bacterium]